MTGLLLEGKLNPRQREYVETIRASAEILMTIVNDILDFSKIEARKLSVEVMNFNLIEMVENTLILGDPDSPEILERLALATYKSKGPTEEASLYEAV